MLSHVMTDFTDPKKQKYLVVVVFFLPMGVMQYNTTNSDIEVGSMQDKLQIKSYVALQHDGCYHAVVQVPAYMACGQPEHATRFSNGEGLQPIKQEGNRFCLVKR